MKSEGSRKAAFALLETLCRYSESALATVAEHLGQLHQHNPRLSQQWAYVPAEAMIASCGYAGLKNQV